MGIFLRLLLRHLPPDDVIRGFADVGISCKDFLVYGPVLVKLYGLFFRIAGLKIRIDKTFLIPHFSLRTRPSLSLGEWVHHHIPDWAGVKITGKAKYLGVQIGPEAQDASWEKPLTEYLKRCRDLQARKLDFFPMMVCYNSICISVLSFVAQISKPPKKAFQAESLMLRTLAGGGYGWFPLHVAFNLQKSGMPCGFRSLKHLARAASFRYVADNLLDYDHTIKTMEKAEGLGDDCLLFPEYNEWGKKLIVSHLQEVADDILQHFGGEADSCDEEHHTEAATKKRRAKKRRTMQGEVYSKVLNADITNMDLDIRRRTQRFRNYSGVSSVEFYNFEMLAQVLRPLASKVPPSAMTVFTKTIFNGWPTERRMGGDIEYSRLGACKCGCSTIGARDTIEHYLICPMLWDFGVKFLKLQVNNNGSNIHIARTLILRPEPSDCRIGLILHVFASYRCVFSSCPCADSYLSAIRLAVSRHFFSRLSPGQPGRSLSSCGVLAPLALAQFCRNLVRRVCWCFFFSSWVCLRVPPGPKEKPEEPTLKFSS